MCWTSAIMDLSSVTNFFMLSLVWRIGSVLVRMSQLLGFRMHWGWRIGSVLVHVSQLSECSLNALRALWVLCEGFVSALWVLCECSVKGLWVLFECSVRGLWVLCECSVNALRRATLQAVWWNQSNLCDVSSLEGYKTVLILETRF